MRTQEHPGAKRSNRRSQEEPGGARRSQQEPGGARSFWEDPRARRSEEPPAGPRSPKVFSRLLAGPRKTRGSKSHKGTLRTSGGDQGVAVGT